MYVYKPRRGMKRSEDSKVRNAQLRTNMIAHFYLVLLIYISLFWCFKRDL